MALSPNTTLIDLRDGLNEEYVRRVLDRMYEEKKRTGPPSVRIGLNSDPTCPDYCIFAEFEEESAPQMMCGYRGKSHREMPGEAFDNFSIWTEASLSLEEVAQLRQYVRAVRLRR